MDILQPYNTPFAVALALLALLLLVQLMGLGDFGPNFDADVDGADGADLLGGLASLIGLNPAAGAAGKGAHLAA